jgi:hypothetical protein
MILYYVAPMITDKQDMVNERYSPTEKDEKVLSALKKGREQGEPWGRANPRWLMDETELSKSSVEFCLRSLHDAGWVDRPSRGLYELIEDPREEISRES